MFKNKKCLFCKLQKIFLQNVSHKFKKCYLLLFIKCYSQIQKSYNFCKYFCKYKFCKYICKYKFCQICLQIQKKFGTFHKIFAFSEIVHNLEDNCVFNLVPVFKKYSRFHQIVRNVEKCLCFQFCSYFPKNIL